MATRMRAKVRLNHIGAWGAEGSKGPTQETLTFNPVARNEAYPEDGSDEDNTYAKFSPSGEFRLTVANPALIGKFAVGETYYVDFIPVPVKATGEQPAVQTGGVAGNRASPAE